jgi:NAD-dependent deacetylase
MGIPQSLIKDLFTAQSIAVLTGAGISAESGIPTFREVGTGLWAQYNPEELATPEAFRTNPELVWDWYSWRRELISQSVPNPGHEALVKLESFLSSQSRDFTLITQNVDGLHQRAGSRNIIELHGNIMRTKCIGCDVKAVDDLLSLQGGTPRCYHCNGFLRPDVVWFGENLPKNVLDTAWNVANRCEIFMSIGTSGIVQPAASLPLIALKNEAVVVEINPNPTPLSPIANHSLQGQAGVLLPELISLIGI